MADPGPRDSSRTGPICQSCGMPMTSPDQFGSAADGGISGDYCRFCFVGGRFTEPAITLPDMIDKCVAVMVRDGVMPATQARALMAQTLAALQRWR